MIIKYHYNSLKKGQEEVASVLLEHKASLTATTKKGFTPLHLAAKYGNLKVKKKNFNFFYNYIKYFSK